MLYAPNLNSQSADVIHGLVQALAQNEQVYLATVISTWGSSPRPPGAMMAYSKKGGMIGSVSGGCIEDDLLARIHDGHFDNPPAGSCRLIQYGGNATDNREHEYSAQSLHSAITLPCGGTLVCTLESIAPAPQTLQKWRAVLHELMQSKGLYRDIPFNGSPWHWQHSAFIRPFAEHDKARVYLGPTRRLLIIGANQITQYLAEIAQALDFNVCVCDPNPHLGTRWTQANFEFIANFPDGFVAQRFGDAHCAVVAVSHDPRLDDMALLEALPSNAYYVGAMGSLATSEARKERLAALEMPAALLTKLHAPIGIDIGSKTPAEIAVSIAADLVKHYAKTLSVEAPIKVETAPNTPSQHCNTEQL